MNATGRIKCPLARPYLTTTCKMEPGDRGSAWPANVGRGIFTAGKNCSLTRRSRKDSRHWSSPLSSEVSYARCDGSWRGSRRGGAAGRSCWRWVLFSTGQDSDDSDVRGLAGELRERYLSWGRGAEEDGLLTGGDGATSLARSSSNPPCHCPNGSWSSQWAIMCKEAQPFQKIPATYEGHVIRACAESRGIGSHTCVGGRQVSDRHYRFICRFFNSLR